jgi:hypothetical protein
MAELDRPGVMDAQQVFRLPLGGMIAMMIPIGKVSSSQTSW